MNTRDALQYMRQSISHRVPTGAFRTPNRRPLRLSGDGDGQLTRELADQVAQKHGRSGDWGTVRRTAMEVVVEYVRTHPRMNLDIVGMTAAVLRQLALDYDGEAQTKRRLQEQADLAEAAARQTSQRGVGAGKPYQLSSEEGDYDLGDDPDALADRLVQVFRRAGVEGGAPNLVRAAVAGAVEAWADAHPDADVDTEAVVADVLSQLGIRDTAGEGQSNRRPVQPDPMSNVPPRSTAAMSHRAPQPNYDPLHVRSLDGRPMRAASLTI